MLAQDEETVELRETFTSLQQEVEAKTKKLKKVNAAQTEQKPACAFTHFSSPPSFPVFSRPLLNFSFALLDVLTVSHEPAAKSLQFKP